MFKKAFIFLLISVSSAASAWYPYAEVRGRSGDYRSGAMVYGFSPLVQSDCSLLFTQANIGQMRHQTTGSVGVGYRQMFGCNSFFGGAVFVDWARTGKHNNYFQGVVSGELIVRCAELRANAYLPSTNNHVVGSELNQVVVLQETDINLFSSSQDIIEQAYPGFDVEVGYNYELSCNSRLRGYAAYFRHARRSTSDICGPRIRVRYEIDNMGWSGCRLLVEGIWQRDNVRGNEIEAMLGFRIPLCRPSCCRPCPFKRRMNDLVERDVGLIVRSNRQPVVETEETIAHLYFFAEDVMGSGTQDDPASLDTVRMAANPGDILFALNQNGPIMFSDTIELQPDQRLYGFDEQATVTIPVGDGLLLTVEDSTHYGRPTLAKAGPGSVISANDRNIIFGLSTTGGSLGISLFGTTDVVLDKLDITQANGIGLNMPSATNITVLNCSVNVGSSNTLVNIVDGSNIAFENCSFTGGANTFGFNIFNSSQQPILVANSSLTQTDGRAIAIANTGTDIDLSGLSVSGTGGEPGPQISVVNTSAGTVLFGDVFLTNMDNTVGNFPFVLIQDNAAEVSFSSLEVQGIDGVGIFVRDTPAISVGGGSLDIADRAAVRLLNTEMDITFSSINSTNSLDLGLSFDNVTGEFTATGPTALTSAAITGIGCINCPGIDLFFADLDITAEFFGIQLAQSNGTFAAGNTTITTNNGRGIEVDDTFMDFAFDQLAIQNLAPFRPCISWETSSGAFFVTGPTMLTGGNLDVSNSGLTTFTFSDLDITNARGSIDWSATPGSFSATGTTTITDDLFTGVTFANSSPINIDFFELNINSPANRGVDLQSLVGTFDAHVVNITNPGASNPSLQVSGGGNDLNVNFGTLNVDAVAANAGEVRLSNCAGSFSVTNGGHINLTNAPNRNGITATDCTGAISITGTDGNLFEISGMGVGNAADIAGVFVSGCESLSLDYCNIHDIGDGNEARFGVFAADMQSLVSVTNSEIDAIDGSDAATSGIAVDSLTIPHDGTKLAVNISENTISTSTNGAIVNFASSIADMGTLEATLADNIVSDQITGLGVNVFDYAKNNVIRIEGNNISDIAGGLIPVGCGAILRDNTESLVCIRDNMLDQGDGNNAVAILIAGDDLAGSADVTVAENTIFTSNNDWNDGILLTTQFFAGNSTGTITILFDSNSIEDVTNNAVAIQANASATLNATLTNNTSSVARARAISSDDNSTINVLFGDPAGGTGMGNAFTDFDLQQQDMSSFNLGAIDTGGTVSQAISDLGNTGTVSPSGTINLIPTTSVPQPMPCPPVVE